jgi:hypothetical protein
MSHKDGEISNPRYTDADVKEIEEALNKATVGPWDFAVFEDSRHVIFDNTYFNRHIAEIVRSGVESEQREEDNARLIANAPKWLRQLLTKLAEKEAELQKAALSSLEWDRLVREKEAEIERLRGLLNNVGK